MKKKTSTMDELTAKIYLAAAQDLVRHRLNVSVEMHLSKTLCISMKTILDRKTKGNWWFEEVRRVAMAFGSTDLNEFLTNQFTPKF